MEPARLRASPEQFSALIEFMERHGDISRPQAGSQGRLRGDQLWSELTSLLNSIGGGVEKTQDKWKKVWADWKTKTKKKYSLIRRHASGTGGGPSNRQSLTALEERVVAVIGVSAIVGQSNIQEQGFSAPSQPSTQSSQQQLSAQSSQQQPAVGQLVLEVPLELNSTPLILSPPEPLAPQARQLPPTPPAQAQGTSPPLPATTPTRSHQQQQPLSLQSAAGTPRHRLLRARRNRGLTPFERATSEFVAVEQRRLRFEEMREKLLHDREIERLRLEAQRIEATREHNRLLHQLGIIAQNLLDTIAQTRSSSLPSTDILPDT